MERDAITKDCVSNPILGTYLCRLTDFVVCRIYRIFPSIVCFVRVMGDGIGFALVVGAGVKGSRK